MSCFLYKSFLRSFYVLAIWVCNLLLKGFWRKSCSLNIAEIDTRWQHGSQKCFAAFLVKDHKWGEISGSFCHQAAVWFWDMFCNFYLVKNCEIAKKSTTTKAREKISTYLESLEFFFFKLMHVRLNLTKKNFLDKIGHRFLFDNQAIS
jgi:hypothetical protein